MDQEHVEFYESDSTTVVHTDKHCEYYHNYNGNNDFHYEPNGHYGMGYANYPVPVLIPTPVPVIIPVAVPVAIPMPIITPGLLHPIYMTTALPTTYNPQMNSLPYYTMDGTKSNYINEIYQSSMIMVPQTEEFVHQATQNCNDNIIESNNMLFVDHNGPDDTEEATLSDNEQYHVNVEDIDPYSSLTMKNSANEKKSNVYRAEEGYLVEEPTDDN